MLKTLQSYRRSIGWVFILGAGAIMMTGFGLDGILGQRAQPYAIKVDDTEIGYSTFYREERDLDERYRRMLGANYDRFAAMMKLDLSKEVGERLVNQALISNVADRFGLHAGDQELITVLSTQLFPNGFDSGMYNEFLRQRQTTAEVFEKELRDDLRRESFMKILSNVSAASHAEATTAYEIDNTKYTISYLEFNPTDYVAKVATPSDDALSTFYKEHAGDYQIAPKVSYEYVVFDPKDNLDTVPVTPEDVEFYYSENSEQFMTRPELRARRILLAFKAKAADKDKEAVKAKATKLLEKLKAGEAFDAAATKNSEDKVTAAKGGDLGWVGESDFPVQVDMALRALKPGEISELITTDAGIEIFKVEERKAPQPKKLEEVRAEIEKKLKLDDAPAYTSAKAHEWFNSWTKGSTPFAAAAEGAKLTVARTPSLLEQGQHPSPDLAGLTDKVFSALEEKRGIVEMGDRTVAFSLIQATEPELPSLEKVKDKVLEAYRASKSGEVARTAADEALKGFTEKKYGKIADAAMALNMKSQELKDTTRNTGNSGPLAHRSAQLAVFSTFEPGGLPSKVYDALGKYYILQVTGITRPAAEDTAKAAADFRKRESQSIAQTLQASIMAKLKATSKIDIKGDILSTSAEG